MTCLRLLTASSFRDSRFATGDKKIAETCPFIDKDDEFSELTTIAI